MTLTQYSGQLASIITTNRRSAQSAGPNESRQDTGLQRVGILVSNAGVANTVYYDPAADALYYDTGNPVISQE